MLGFCPNLLWKRNVIMTITLSRDNLISRFFNPFPLAARAAAWPREPSSLVKHVTAGEAFRWDDHELAVQWAQRTFNMCKVAVDFFLRNTEALREVSGATVAVGEHGNHLLSDGLHVRFSRSWPALLSWYATFPQYLGGLPIQSPLLRTIHRDCTGSRQTTILSRPRPPLA